MKSTNFRFFVSFVAGTAISVSPSSESSCLRKRRLREGGESRSAACSGGVGSFLTGLGDFLTGLASFLAGVASFLTGVGDFFFGVFLGLSSFFGVTFSGLF